MPGKVRFLYQKLTRGFSDDVTWSLDHSIAKWVLPRLKRFKHVNMGYPCCLNEFEWDSILDKMIAAFTLLADDDSISCREGYEENQKIIDEGLILFTKHYQSLWW